MKKFFKLHCYLITLIVLGSCGKADKMPTFESTYLPIDGSNINGVYLAELKPINEHLSGISGSATLYRKLDRMTAMVRLKDATPNIAHTQKVYLGSRCPTEKDDVNGDGLIDPQEGKTAWGMAIIPLDDDITTQFGGKDLFPRSDVTGDYYYERSSEFEALFSDLKALDTDFEDDLAKLNLNSGLMVEERVIVIQGTADWEYLPDTVASTPGLSKNASLPIACGTFKKVSSIPEEEASSGSVEEPNPQPPTVSPSPTPSPYPSPAPNPLPRRDNEEEESESWYERVVEWWRRRWQD